MAKKKPAHIMMMIAGLKSANKPMMKKGKKPDNDSEDAMESMPGPKEWDEGEGYAPIPKKKKKGKKNAATY